MPYTTPPAAGTPLRGSVLATLLAERENSIVAWGRRTTDSSTTTSEVGVLRLDSIALEGGYQYRFWTSSLSLDTSVTNDEVGAQLRYSTSGTATTSSTIMPGSDARERLTDANFPESENIVAIYTPSTDETMSVLLTVRRVAGTGNAMIAANAGSIDLVVERIGPAVSDTGTDI